MKTQVIKIGGMQQKQCLQENLQHILKEEKSKINYLDSILGNQKKKELCGIQNKKQQINKLTQIQTTEW